MAKMGGEPKERPKVRAACLGMLVRLRLPEKKRNPLLRFIDAYLPLTLAQEKEFEEELNRFQPKEREVAMEYVTSWERKGRLEGKLEGKLEVAIELLTQRLGPLSAATTKRLRSLTLERVETLLSLLLDFKRPPAFNSKAELERWLRANAPARRAANGQHQRGQQ